MRLYTQEQKAHIEPLRGFGNFMELDVQKTPWSYLVIHVK